jgi:hypothetical protein
MQRQKETCALRWLLVICSSMFSAEGTTTQSDKWPILGQLSPTIRRDAPAVSTVCFPTRCATDAVNRWTQLCLSATFPAGGYSLAAFGTRSSPSRTSRAAAGFKSFPSTSCRHFGMPSALLRTQRRPPRPYDHPVCLVPKSFDDLPDACRSLD